jgi:hypothetical protein
MELGGRERADLAFFRPWQPATCIMQIHNFTPIMTVLVADML